jgi:Helix-turn-helix
MASKTDDERRAIALSSGLGRTGLYFDDDDVLDLLRAAVEREGSQRAFAERYCVDRAYINALLNGKRRVSGVIVKALGLRNVYVVE